MVWIRVWLAWRTTSMSKTPRSISRRAWVLAVFRFSALARNRSLVRSVAALRVPAASPER